MQKRLMLSRIGSAVFVHTKGSQVAVVDGELIADGTFQFDVAAVSPTSDLAFGQHGEPSFDGRCLVGAVVVHHQTHVEESVLT
jgi:hypothetical protein